MPTFETNMIEIFGKRGAAWLKTLPTRIEHCAKAWHLSHLIPVLDLTYHYVMFGQRGDMPIILKIGIDLETLENEARCLSSFAGHGCIKILDHDFRIGALLLECVRPGYSLKSFFPDQEKQALQAAAMVMRALQQVPQQHTDFPTIADWLKQLDYAWDLPAAHLEKARHLKNILLITQEEPRLLHGDLHHGNILAHGASWIAIDPKGVIGEAAYEVGAYLRNPIPDLNHHPNAQTIVKQRIHDFAEALNFDPQRLADWNYVQAVLSTCWMIADNLSPQPFLDYLEIIERN